MSIDTRTPAEIKYDAERNGTLYVKPSCSTCGDDGDCPDCGKPSAWQPIIDLITSGDDGSAHTKQDEDTRMRQWREQQRTTGSPEMRSLLDWIDEHFDAEERSARFAAGVRDGLMISQAIIAGDEQAIAEWIDTPISEAEEDIVTACAGGMSGANWTEYSAGDVTLTIQHNGFVPHGGTPYMLEIMGHDIDGPWTIAMLQQLMISLGYLLSDDRVLTAPAGDEPEDTDTIASILEAIDGGE